MATFINGYELEGELSMRDAGNSRWGFCSKGGHSYYIKEFLKPVYPESTDELSPRLVERKRRACENFYRQKLAFYDALMRSRTGNNMVVHDFFRSGSRYYVVTDRVFAAPMKPADVARLSDTKKMVFLRALVYSVAALHTNRIVHADLKPDNLLVKRTTEGYVTPKVIDFDAGFLENDIPQEVAGDFVYLAPEARLRMEDASVSIDHKIDVFALGILMHQYWTGEVPGFPAKYHYAFEAVLNNEPLTFKANFPVSLRVPALKALQKKPQDRPDATELLRDLGGGAPEPRNETHTRGEGASGFTGTSDSGHRRGFYVPVDLG